MFEGFEDLYQEVIMDHNKKPRNFSVMEDPDRKVDGQNPLCGDEITLFVALDGDTIKAVTFQGHGCAISKSSASVMTETVKGKTVAEAHDLFRVFHDLVTGEAGAADPTELGTMAVFTGVARFPARVKCASLAWHALTSALKGDAETVTTE